MSKAALSSAGKSAFEFAQRNTKWLLAGSAGLLIGQSDYGRELRLAISPPKVPTETRGYYAYEECILNNLWTTHLGDDKHLEYSFDERLKAARSILSIMEARMRLARSREGDYTAREYAAYTEGWFQGFGNREHNTEGASRLLSNGVPTAAYECLSQHL